MKGACHKSRLRSFINPTPTDSPQNRAALRVCSSCPVIRECAEQALTSGLTLKPGFAGPAQDVIQAGVVCRGDLTTAFELASVAGVPVPDYQSIEKVRRNKAGDECSHCERPMVPWTRGDVPEGYVMHRGRGFCTHCRAAYNEHLEREGHARPGLRKAIDRKRHHYHAPTQPERNARQMELFPA